MNLTPLACCLAIALMAMGGGAAAETERRSAQVYRCGPEGRDLRDAPCADQGAARPVEYDQPSAAQQREARERARLDARQADALQRERQREEAQRPPGAIGIHGRGRPEPAAQPASAAAQKPLTAKKPKTKKPKTSKSASAASG